MLKQDDNTHKAILSGIQRATSEYYEQDYAELSKSRKEAALKVRRMVAMIARTFYPDVPFKTIGKVLGGFSHQAVMNLYSRCKSLVETEAATKSDFNAIVRRLMSSGTLDSLELKERVKKDYLHVDLNEIKLLRISEKQMLIFKGLDQKIILQIKQVLNVPENTPVRQLNKTGLSILEPIE